MILAATTVLAALALSQPPATAPAQPPLDWKTLEAGVFSDYVQLTSRDLYVKAGEAYFSPDDKWVIFQAVEVPAAGKEADPFYAMYVAPLLRGEDGRKITGLGKAIRVSAPNTANTCGWFDPSRNGMVLFGSTVVKPADEQKSGFQVGTRKYVWMFPAEMEVVQTAVIPMLEISTKEGGVAQTSNQAYQSLRLQLEQLKASLNKPSLSDATGLGTPGKVKGTINAEMLDLDLKRVEELAAFEGPAKPLFEKPNYDAECSYSKDGRFVLYAHVEAAQEGQRPDANIFIYDTLTKKHHSIVVGPGYDGGPFFSADNKRICYRSDRKGDDLLQLFMADLKWVDGVPVGIEREYQLTDNGAVNWAPYFSPKGDYLIYGSSEVGHHNYEIFAIELNQAKLDEAAAKAGKDATTIPVAGLHRTRLTHADGADVLPVFSNDGSMMMWTSQRGPKVAGEERPSSQLWIATYKGLPTK